MTSNEMTSSDLTCVKPVGGFDVKDGPMLMCGEPGAYQSKQSATLIWCAGHVDNDLTSFRSSVTEWLAIDSDEAKQARVEYAAWLVTYEVERQAKDALKAQRLANGPRVFVFASTGEAYDYTQTSDDIYDGDVLHIPSENVTGFLHEAWPIALTDHKGQLHGINDGVDPATLNGGDYSKSVELARTLMPTCECDDDHACDDHATEALACRCTNAGQCELHATPVALHKAYPHIAGSVADCAGCKAHNDDPSRRLLTFDEVDALGLDATGRDGHADFPYRANSASVVERQARASAPVLYVRSAWGRDLSLVHAIVQRDEYAHARCDSSQRLYLFTTRTRAQVERDGDHICKRCARLVAQDDAR